MSQAIMTMQGLNAFDPTLFDGLVFPAGIDKQIATDEILLRSGEFCVLYTNPVFMKAAITHWGKKHYRTFEKWIDALAIEFEPLYNYDRYEEYTDEKKRSGLVNNKGNETEQNEGVAVSSTNTKNTGTGENKRGVSAYDSSTYQPREKEETSNGSETAGSGLNNSKENISRSSDNATVSNDSENITHTAHLYGNIGVTTSTQMLEDYIRVERFNIYEQIANIFVDEFCLMVY